MEQCPDAVIQSSQKANTLMQKATEIFTTAEAAEAAKATEAAEATEHAWERHPPKSEEDHVLGHTQNWLNALPKGVRPVHLPTAFPRIANQLCRLWAETAALDRYFEEKEFGTRDDRKGFPALIKEELLAMHVHSLRSRGHRKQVARQAASFGQ